MKTKNQQNFILTSILVKRERGMSLRTKVEQSFARKLMTQTSEIQQKIVNEGFGSTFWFVDLLIIYSVIYIVTFHMSTWPVILPVMMFTKDFFPAGLPLMVNVNSNSGDWFSFLSRNSDATLISNTG